MPIKAKQWSRPTSDKVVLISRPRTLDRIWQRLIDDRIMYYNSTNQQAILETEFGPQMEVVNLFEQCRNDIDITRDVFDGFSSVLIQALRKAMSECIDGLETE